MSAQADFPRHGFLKGLIVALRTLAGAVLLSGMASAVAAAQVLRVVGERLGGARNSDPDVHETESISATLLQRVALPGAMLGSVAAGVALALVFLAIAEGLRLAMLIERNTRGASR